DNAARAWHAGTPRDIFVAPRYPSRSVIVSLNLIKLCVGCDSVKDLEQWIRERLKDPKNRGPSRDNITATPMVPNAAGELTDGGSLYWVIRGEIACRQRLLDVRPFVDKEGVGRCHLVLEPKLVLVEPRPFRAFQGWRYLAPKDAPRDLDRAAPGARNMPEALRRELRELGLLCPPDAPSDLPSPNNDVVPSARLKVCRRKTGDHRSVGGEITCDLDVSPLPSLPPP